MNFRGVLSKFKTLDETVINQNEDLGIPYDLGTAAALYSMNSHLSE